MNIGEFSNNGWLPDSINWIGVAYPDELVQTAGRPHNEEEEDTF